MSSQNSRVFAIVPAAGRSRRMGAAKQLLAVGGQPMLLAMLEPLAAAQVAGVVLVTHQTVAELVAVGHLRGVVVMRNDDAHSEMIDSIRIGLRAWLERESMADSDGFLVCPADQPGISTADFDACIAAFRAASDRIIVASRAGRRGHPLIFPASLADFVQSAACDSGLNALPRAFAARTRAVECHSPGVTTDVDTLGDYERLR